MPIIQNNKLFEPLFEMLKDVERAEKDLDANDDPYSRRNFVRALFAMIEGTLFILKQTILATASDGSIQLSTKEEAKLREKSFDVKAGKVSDKNKYLTLEENIRFTKKQLEKHFSLTLNIGSQSDWDEFKSAIKLRNDLTHPKSLKEFEISTGKVVLAKRVGHWFGKFIIDWVTQFAPMLRAVDVIDADSTTN